MGKARIERLPSGLPSCMHVSRETADAIIECHKFVNAGIRVAVFGVLCLPVVIPILAAKGIVAVKGYFQSKTEMDDR